MSTLVSWSGGKDACAALHALQGEGATIAGLLTTLAPDPLRVGVHEVGVELIRRQAAVLRLPLHEAPVPAAAGNAAYEAALARALRPLTRAGADALAFGDLHLADIRAFRDALAARLGMRPLYPVWGRDPAEFARWVIAAGFRAVVCSVDLSRLDLGFAGRAYDERFLADLPPGVDPCGENGEFHTFVHDGPTFAAPVALRLGGRRAEGRFGVCELSPA